MNSTLAKPYRKQADVAWPGRHARPASMSKNRVGVFEVVTYSCTRVIWPQVPETHQETYTTTTTTVSDVVEWLSNDPIGISGGLNQYVAFGNNPVMFVDPWGLKIVIRPTYPELMLQVKRAIELIEQVPVGSQMLNDLRNSDRIYHISIGDNRGPWPTGITYYDDCEVGGANILWDPEDAFYGLAHEIGHAWGKDRGLEPRRPPNYTVRPGTTPPWEEYSMALENFVRIFHGIDPRISYW